MTSEDSPAVLRVSLVPMAPKVVKIIYDQGLFPLPERKQKIKFDAGWLHRFSALNMKFILNADEDMKGQIMVLWLGNQLLLILPERQIVYIKFSLLLFCTFRNWNHTWFCHFLIWADIWSG